MKGLELSRQYYEKFGKPMLESEFSPYLDRIAVGLVGHGSECFGFDDEISKDHDYEAGFCLWIDEEADKEFGFKLFRAYRRLPKEYEEVKMQEESVLGSKFKGVHTIKEFYSFYTGTGDVPETLDHWLSIPDFYLAEATNGLIFSDPQGEFSRIRGGLMHRPEDIRLKKLAECLFAMAQCGQYNYGRCIDHKQYAAAATTLSDFAKYAAEAIYHLNKAYAPYYKWLFKGLENLSILSDLNPFFYELMQEPYNQEKNFVIIEKISTAIIAEIKNQDLSNRSDDYLEPFAYDVMSHINDSNLRNSSPIR